MVAPKYRVQGSKSSTYRCGTDHTAVLTLTKTSHEEWSTTPPDCQREADKGVHVRKNMVTRGLGAKS